MHARLNIAVVDFTKLFSECGQKNVGDTIELGCSYRPTSWQFVSAVVTNCNGVAENGGKSPDGAYITTRLLFRLIIDRLTSRKSSSTWLSLHQSRLFISPMMRADYLSARRAARSSQRSVADMCRPATQKPAMISHSKNAVRTFGLLVPKVHRALGDGRRSLPANRLVFFFFFIPQHLLPNL